MFHLGKINTEKVKVLCLLSKHKFWKIIISMNENGNYSQGGYSPNVNFSMAPSVVREVF